MLIAAGLTALFVAAIVFAAAVGLGGENGVKT